MHEPRNLSEMQQAINYYERLMNDIASKEKEFPKISDQFGVLAKYEVEVEDQILRKYKLLIQKWSQYLNTLAKAEEMLNRNKDMFKHGLLEKGEKLKSQLAELYSNFIKSMPTTVDVSASGKRVEVVNLYKSDLKINYFYPISRCVKFLQ